MKRFSVSVSDLQAAQLDYVSGKLGITRAALVSVMLEQALPGVVQIASCLPEPGDPLDDEGVRRLRGRSSEVIREQVSKLMEGAQDDLFGK